eukprot:CAMPEP_0181447452 /NCGR_PEP_ID=MMETSP1110-20121109/26630_1 /TAXON_ID=174948 /ORGANISM="Symbiodinium sp., Strain CCMP421" /LENGTH=67 /DNA_ID=CAMNT_0023571567 /DNA_START=26 /DNA_END=225 /DNA_ORIENTATION=-
MSVSYFTAAAAATLTSRFATGELTKHWHTAHVLRQPTTTATKDELRAICKIRVQCFGESACVLFHPR